MYMIVRALTKPVIGVVSCVVIKDVPTGRRVKCKVIVKAHSLCRAVRKREKAVEVMSER